MTSIIPAKITVQSSREMLMSFVRGILLVFIFSISFQRLSWVRFSIHFKDYIFQTHPWPWYSALKCFPLQIPNKWLSEFPWYYTEALALIISSLSKTTLELLLNLSWFPNVLWILLPFQALSLFLYIYLNHYFYHVVPKYFMYRWLYEFIILYRSWGYTRGFRPHTECYTNFIPRRRRRRNPSW